MIDIPSEASTQQSMYTRATWLEGIVSLLGGGESRNAWIRIQCPRRQCVGKKGRFLGFRSCNYWAERRQGVWSIYLKNYSFKLKFLSFVWRLSFSLFHMGRDGPCDTPTHPVISCDFPSTRCRDSLSPPSPLLIWKPYIPGWGVIENRAATVHCWEVWCGVMFCHSSTVEFEWVSIHPGRVPPEISWQTLMIQEWKKD